MEAVRAFNNELSSLYESKPPVSRAKMAQITKCAIKAIKFYKHVVQSVEKFIQKCKPEYKVPGLYVIDSIVRQSRHQFGPEKDVFSPRFTKNIIPTFINMFKCPVEERSRVVRVLNLWQKNCVFPAEIIQPLLDLAADPENADLIAAAQRSVDGVVDTSHKVQLPVAQPSSNGGDSNSSQIMQQTEMLSTITKLLKQAQEGTTKTAAPESQLQQLQQLQHQLVMQTEEISKPQQQATPPIDSNLLAQIQVLTSQLLNKPSGGSTETVEDTNKQNVVDKQFSMPKQNSVEPLFNKKLLDFDYGDSDEDDDREDHHHHHQQVQPIVSQPAVMHPSVTQPAVMHPSVTQPAMMHPSVTQPAIVHPSMTQPVIVHPSMTQPAILHPSVTQPAMVHPSVIQPAMVHPSVIQPTIVHPSVTQPAMMHPSVTQPAMIHPSVTQPTMVHLVVTQPSVKQQGLPPVMPDQNILHQIQQISQQQEQLQSEIGAQDQLRRRLLEQQQQQFDREIEQESLINHLPTHGFSQDQDRRLHNEQDDRNNRENSDRNNHENSDKNNRENSDRSNRESSDRADHRRHKESKDRSRSPRRRSRRSRSRSRDRRRRSRSRDRHRRSRSRERERREREKERERRKMGFPPVKGNNISICSTTLWLGRLTKHTTEDELREHIEKYGTIRTINMIPPRGCAFVCLTKRKDAYKVLDRLKDVKINGNAIKIAWAPGIGVKESAFKDLWDVDLGVTYIPWAQLPKDVLPLLAGGMVDEESLPERLKGMKTGEEEEEVQPQQDPGVESVEVPSEDKVVQQQPPPPMPLSFPPGQPPPGFHLPGHNPLNLMGPGGPLSLLSGPPPPIGMGPPIRLGGPSNMADPNTFNTIGNLNIGALAGNRGPVPNLPGMRPAHMNFGPRGPMMGGLGVHPNQGMDTHSSFAGGPRSFGQFSMPRFPHMQNPGGMQPFVNNENNGGDQTGMGDSDMRAVAETKEWPPDDEVNAEDESDGDHPMDSDDRMLSMVRQHIPGPGMPNLQGFRNPFGLRGPMLPGQGPPNPMLGIPGAPNPNTGMPSLISLHMMPPHQQVLTVPAGSASRFALAPAGMRVPMPAVGVRQGLMPTVSSPHLLPPSTGAPLSVAVSVNGSVVVTRPGLPSSIINVEGADKPSTNSEGPPSEEDKVVRDGQGPVPLVQIHGVNRPPGVPVLGRGFAPMTIRPRGAVGLLGVRPGAHGGGINRFGSPHPLMRPAFGGMDRPPFVNRFGAPLRPPVGFLDLDEREDRDERRPLPTIDVDDQPDSEGVMDQNMPKDIDERKSSNEVKGRNQDIDMRQDIDERSKTGRVSGRPSRWCAGGHDEASESLPAAGQTIEGKVTENSAISALQVIEGTSTTLNVQPASDMSSTEPPTPVTPKADSAQKSVEVSFIEKSEGSGLLDKIVSGESDAIQPIRSNDIGGKASS